MPRPLRIVFVCRSFPAHRTGGMESHARDVVEELLAQGHKVSVVTTPLPRGDVAVVGTRTITLGSARGGAYSLGFMLGLAEACAREASRLRADLIHAQGFAGIPLVLNRRHLPPVVTTVHGTLWSETALQRQRSLTPGERMREALRHWKRLVIWPFWRAFLWRVRHIVTDSHFSAGELAHEGFRGSARVVPLGFVVSPREPAELDPEVLGMWPGGSHRRHDVVRVLGIGRLDRGKGWEVLLEALSQVETCVGWGLILAGTGAQEKRLRRLVRKLGLQDKVTLTGRVDEALRERLLAQADVFVNPDQGQPAFGLANAEAMVAGLPVLASAVGAHSEIIRGGDGWLVSPPASRRAWKREIERMLLAMPEAGVCRANRARQAARRFSRQRMGADLEEVYRSVLAKSRQ